LGRQRRRRALDRPDAVAGAARSEHQPVSQPLQVSGADRFTTMAVTVESVGVRRRPESSFGRTLRKSQPAYIMLSPYILLFLVVLAYPLLYSISLSFFDATLNRTPTFVGDGIFVQLFSDPEFYTALRNTFFFAFFVVIGETILPLAMALAMNEHLPF